LALLTGHVAASIIKAPFGRALELNAKRSFDPWLDKALLDQLPQRLIGGIQGAPHTLSKLPH
jgi:hypothetical protein